MDYDSLASVGTALGSGALLIMDESTCIVDIVKSFLKFFAHESCGKCVPCREGTFHLYNILRRISEGEGEMKDLERLVELSETMQKASLCALGQSPAVSIKGALKYFREEFEKHIKDKECPCGVCPMEPQFISEDLEV